MAKVLPPAAWEHSHYVAWLDRNVEPGQSVEVPDGDLSSYLAAGWTQEKAAQPRKNVKES